MTNILVSILACATLMGCADKKIDTPSTHPAIQVSIKDEGVSSLTLSVNVINATGCAALCLEDGDEAPSAERIYAEGVKGTLPSGISGTIVLTVEGLEMSRNYTAYVVGYDSKGAFSLVSSINLKTAGGVDFLYDWESNRTELPRYDNLALCYGGSAHRSPVKWDKERFSTHVTYTNAAGNEKWLFDAFLAIEFVDTQRNMSLNLGQGRPSANKESWQALIDYWFEKGYGFDALNNAVGDAIKRLGYPDTKRKVIMVVPDPIPYQMYSDTNSATAYWGTLDGEKMDFANAKHRLKAMEWYIDEVRERWSKAGYKNLEFAGFYCVSEDLAVPSDYGMFDRWHGWCPELKHWEDIYPTINKYIHSANETMTWIPYYRAGGYEFWSDFQFDYAMMQPNHFWGNHPEYSLKTFTTMVTKNGMSMELEMDNALLEASEGSDVYRARFREYMALAKEIGLYGTRELSYYMGGNTLYMLAKSSSDIDHKLYLEFCDFVASNKR